MVVADCRTNENTNTSPERMYYDTRRHSKGCGGKGACAWEGDGVKQKDDAIVITTVAGCEYGRRFRF